MTVPPEEPEDEVEDDDPEVDEAGTFTPRQLDRTVLALPLIRQLDEERKSIEKGEQAEPKPHAVVIELNLEHPEPRVDTREEARRMIKEAIQTAGLHKDAQEIRDRKSRRSEQYLFARLEGEVIRQLVRLNEPERPIFRIWPDFPIRRL